MKEAKRLSEEIDDLFLYIYVLSSFLPKVMINYKFINNLV